MNAKLVIYMGIVKRLILPVVLGATVVWLIANNYADWADAVCSVSNAMGLNVTECNSV